MSIPVVAAHDVHEWLSFEHDGATYTFDATFLLSNWTCIYGAGCPGIGEEPAPELELGCCSWGAHFIDKKDRKSTLRRVAQLDAAEWQFKAEAEAMGGSVFKNDDGVWQTQMHDGACIFLNRPGFATGAGCAFHHAAMAREESYLDWKPEVCWQVPVRLDFHRDDNDHLTYMLREWKRRDWGPGGDDFHWWCTEDPQAFVGHEPVYVACRADIEALVGQSAYLALAELLQSRSTTGLEHPALNRELHTAEG